MGGEAHTRDPTPVENEDPRKTIPEGESFEEYMKRRAGGDGRYGKYDDKLWDNEAKKDVYNMWDPNQPRSANNFNPFETWEGNSPDASGFYPGEGFYKDPIRGNVNFQQMMEEREEAEQRAANPKPGDAPGAP